MNARKPRGGAMPWWLIAQYNSQSSQVFDPHEIIIVKQGTSQPSQQTTERSNQDAAQQAAQNK